jgi:uncharacterized protein YvpB
MDIKIRYIAAALCAALALTVPAGTALRNSGIDAGASETAADTSETERTALVSTPARAYRDGLVYIDIRTVFQLPELPTGCEVTALTMLLNYYGFSADKVALAENYLPKSTYMSLADDGKVYVNNFFDVFLGDPFGRGWGCFSNAIAYAARSYIADQNQSDNYRVINLSGSDPEELYDYVKDGVPVIVWGTMNFQEPVFNFTYYDILTGEALDWYSREHCYVLAGFDKKKNIVYINDPYLGIVSVNRNIFELRYNQMHKQAVTIIKRPERPAARVAPVSNPNPAASPAAVNN